MFFAEGAQYGVKIWRRAPEGDGGRDGAVSFSHFIHVWLFQLFICVFWSV